MPSAHSCVQVQRTISDAERSAETLSRLHMASTVDGGLSNTMGEPSRLMVHLLMLSEHALRIISNSQWLVQTEAFLQPGKKVI